MKYLILLGLLASAGCIGRVKDCAIVKEVLVKPTTCNAYWKVKLEDGRVVKALETVPLVPGDVLKLTYVWELDEGECQ